MTSWSDEEIISGLRAASEAADTALVTQYTGFVLSVARRQGLQLADAQDIANNVFLATIGKGRAGVLAAPLKAWLRTVTQCRAIDRYRRDQARRKREKVVGRELKLAKSGSVDGDPRKVALVTEAMDRLRIREEKRRGSRADVSDVQVLDWIAAGATNQELAENLGTSVNTAKQRRHRVMNYLREELEHLKNATVAQPNSAI